MADPGRAGIYKMNMAYLLCPKQGSAQDCWIHVKRSRAKPAGASIWPEIRQFGHQKEELQLIKTH